MALLTKDGSLLHEAQSSFVRAADHGCKLEAGRFILDRHDSSVTDRDTNLVIELTRLEYKLLDVLMRNAHQPVARDVLYENVWAHLYHGTNCLDVTVNYLRRKLGRDSILTIRGFGYQFNAAFHVSLGVSA